MNTDSNNQNNKYNQSSNGKLKKRVSIGRFFAALVVFVIVGWCVYGAFNNVVSIIRNNSMFYYGELSNQPVLYTKDDGVYIHKLGEDKSYHITATSPSHSQFSKDGKRIFMLCDKKLLYINFNDMNYHDIASSVHTIDENVTDFSCSTDGRYISYRKGRHSLYACKTGEKPFLVANNVFGRFFINETDNNIIYTVYNSDLCVYNINRHSVTRTNNVDLYEFKNNYSNKLYYLSDDTLYYRENNNTPQFIAANMTCIFNIGSNIFTISQRNNSLVYIYMIENNKVKLTEQNVSDITDDFGSSVIYKRKSKKGFETCLLNSDGKNFRLFTENSAASNYTVSEDGKTLYAVMDYHTGENTLMKFTVNEKGINERTIVAEDVSSYILLKNGNTVYITSSGAYMHTGKKSILLSTYDIHDVTMSEDAVYFAETADNSNFNILRVKNGSVQFLVENSSEAFHTLTSSDIIYIQNDNLYFKHGNEDSKLIDNNAKSLLKPTKYN